MALCCVAQGARAEPLSKERSEPYYVWNWIGTGAALLGAGGLTLAAPDAPGPDWAIGDWDRKARQNFSDSASSRSDQLLALVVTLPLAMQMSDGFDTAFGNAALIYTQAQATSVLLNATAKLAFGRPRPYTHSDDPRVREFAAGEGADAFASFYSGHASLSLTGAMAGSILYAMRTDDLVARHVVWGLEFGLAGVTAQLRIRAGRHYPSDVWTGALIGAGIGFAVPVLHGVELERIRATEWAVAGGAFAVTMVGGEILRLGQSSEGASARSEHPSDDFVRVVVLPVASESGAGLELYGVF